MKATKSKRHPNVFRREDGRWTVKVKVRHNGKQVFRERALPEGATEDDAAKLALELKEQVKSPPPTPTLRQLDTSRSVEDYARGWLETRCKRLKPAAAAHYETVLWEHVIPRIGHLPVSAVCRGMVESWVVWAEQQMQPERRLKDGSRHSLSGRPYARDTLLAWWRPMATMLRDLAADHGLADPTTRVRPPQPRHGEEPVRETGTLSQPEVRKLLDAAKTLTPGRFPEIALMALTGMRAGEVYALHWDSVDFDKERIEVRRTMSAGVLVETTKTNKPRTVPLHPTVMEALREHRLTLVRKQHPGLRGNFVFPNDRGQPRQANSLNGPLELAAEAAGIAQKVTPQVLRRTFNTLMVLAGTDRITLRSIMGHSSEEMTQRYSGVPDAAKAQALRVLLPAAED